MKLSRGLAKQFAPDAQLSYAQFGEDLILANLFFQLDIKKPTYLDIGANEPRYISNTYYFYSRGSQGVLIEPNFSLYKKLKRQRPKDISLNFGISFEAKDEADFYLFPNHANGLSTFSEKDAKHWQEVGMKGVGKITYEIIKVPLVPINDILEKYFKNKPLNLISLDVEGLDLDILKSLDFTRYQPDAICIETLAYDTNQKGFKITGIDELMNSKSYQLYADTRVNSIYCRNDIFNK